MLMLYGPATFRSPPVMETSPLIVVPPVTFTVPVNVVSPVTDTGPTTYMSALMVRPGDPVGWLIRIGPYKVTFGPEPGEEGRLKVTGPTRVGPVHVPPVVNPGIVTVPPVTCANVRVPLLYVHWACIRE